MKTMHTYNLVPCAIDTNMYEYTYISSQYN
jgi:hypothetical protein